LILPVLFLIGYRASGKTSVAQAVARRVAAQVYDTDALVEAATGMSISRCFAERGEEYFRVQERHVLRELVDRVRGAGCAVVATGGGMVLASDNVALMREAGLVVWLVADAETLRQRLEADRGAGRPRPALRGVSSTAEVEEVLREREPLYRSAAHHAVPTAGLSVEAVADQVVALWH
jgi:shikimate kinase